VPVAVGVGPGNAAEQGAGSHPPAVELDRTYRCRRRITSDTEYLDVMDQIDHLHWFVIHELRRGDGNSEPVRAPT
jgi:hypothetical protein